ncbi:hypothetical protein HDU84_001650 [Entophlyctis sp. JEL0112]|nr:hypothetical protein HDU84_001650 [Entophlyctis sp. JEL0112]
MDNDSSDSAHSPAKTKKAKKSKSKKAKSKSKSADAARKKDKHAAPSDDADLWEEAAPAQASPAEADNHASFAEPVSENPGSLRSDPSTSVAVRDTWMTDAAGSASRENHLALFGVRASSRDPSAKVTDAERERERKDAIRRERELNKDYFNPNFGQTLPSSLSNAGLPSQPLQEKKVVFGDSKSAWRMMRLKRLQESAKEDGRDIKDVAIERWGSLVELNQLLEERDFLDGRNQGSQPSRVDNATTVDHAPRSRDPSKPFDGSYNRSVATTEKFKSSSDFKRPQLNEDRNLDLFSRNIPNDATGTRYSAKNSDTAVSHSIPLASTGGAVTDYPSGSSSVSDVMSLADLNKLNARILRNSMMGKNDPELVNQYEREKARYEASKSSESSVSLESRTVVVPTVDSRGRLQEVGDGSQSHRLLGNSKRKREDLKATHDATGQRLLYPGDTHSGLSVNEMLLQEKMGTAGSYDSEIANRITRDATYREDLDYMDERAEDLAKKPLISDFAKRQNAINDYKRANTALEKCMYCIQESTGVPKSTVLATATRTYLALPNTVEMVPYHCQIVPIAHTLTSLELDDDDWTEVRNFMKCLIQMNWERAHGCIFMEQEALMASEEEWSQHKKIIDTSKNGFRKSLVKNMPYFHVWFEPNKGYGHVIEDSEAWPEWFGRETLGSMMELSPDKWRKPKRASPENIASRKSMFKSAFQKYDWTKALE